MIMKAAVLYRLHDGLRVESVDLGPPRQGEVLVRIAACGVCHSDLHVIEGSLPYPLPVVLGHEGAGVVEETGPGVSYVRPGDHVILSFVPTCGRCRYCAAGKPHLCSGYRTESGALADSTRRLNHSGQEINHFLMLSAFAEYAVVPEASLVKIRPDIPLDKACLIGCGIMTGVGAAMNTAKVKPGSSCLVIGCGGVGLNVIQGCALAGASQIIAVDLLESKLEMARALGATHSLNPSSADVLSAVRDFTDGGVDYAFEVIGKAETVQLAFRCTGRGGLTVVVGLSPRGSNVSLPSSSFLLEKAITGSMYGSARPRIDMPMLAGLYLSGRLKIDELITRTYSLDEVNQAFDDLRSGSIMRGVILP